MANGIAVTAFKITAGKEPLLKSKGLSGCRTWCSQERAGELWLAKSALVLLIVMFTLEDSNLCALGGFFCFVLAISGAVTERIMHLRVWAQTKGWSMQKRKVEKMSTGSSSYCNVVLFLQMFHYCPSCKKWWQMKARLLFSFPQKPCFIK